MSGQVPDLPDRDAAVAFLDARIGQGVKPGLDRISGLLDFMADPQLTYPVVHVAGTNGKTTVARLVTDVLGAHGLHVGTFVSPHLHRVEERISLGGVPLTGDQFVALLSENAWIVEEFERQAGEGVTYFELTAALAFAAFAAAAVDVAVVEVGLGGRWDATNVVDAAVSIVTGIAMDHMAYLGDTIGEISAEKAAILKDEGLLVTGPVPAAAEGPITAQVAATGSRWFRFGDEFGVESAVPGVGGWSADIRGVYAEYDELYLPLHGRHQVDNLATAVAACEAVLERPLDHGALTAALAATTSPARIEVLQRRPLIIVDGAHNDQGMEALARTVEAEFTSKSWNLVVGMRGGRDVGALLAPLRGLAVRVWATEPDDVGAIPAAEVAAAVGGALGVEVEVVESVVQAVAAAVAAAGDAGAVLVTGSLYTAAEARAALVGEAVLPSGVHVRIEADVDVSDVLEASEDE